MSFNSLFLVFAKLISSFGWQKGFGISQVNRNYSFLSIFRFSLGVSFSF